MRSLLFSFLTAWFAAMASSTFAADAAPPNVVLFLVDDMGWMDCGVYGSKYYETPNIDRFASRAVRFTSAYACPLCSPTRACIITGKYQSRHGILTASGHQPPQPEGHNFMPTSAPPNRSMISPESKNYLDPAEQNLAETLRAAGYRTAHIGKWHLGMIPPYRPEQNGFDVAFHCAPDPGPPGEYFSPYGVVPEGRPTAKAKIGTITDGPPGEYIVDRQADEAVKFIADCQARKQPFFLNLWCYGVHGPWGHKPAYTAEFAKKSDPRGLQSNPIMGSMLHSVDECFGRIMAELDGRGLAENTIVVFYSDNGGNTHSNVPGSDKTAAAEKHKSEFLADWRKWAGDQPPTNNAPLRDGKGSLYEGGTRVPMMWSWPGHVAPAVNDAVAGHIDVYPTLLELVGLAKPPEQVMDGVSLAPELLGKGRVDRRAFFNIFPFRPNEGGVTVRSGEFKLIRWFDRSLPLELYNLRDDLSEANNLVEQMPEKARELDALIDGFLKDTGALVPRPNPAFQPAQASSLMARPLGGWVARSCVAEEKDGALVVTGTGRNPFLGVSGLNQQGPVTLLLDASASVGGAGKAQWRTVDQESFPETGQVVSFDLPKSAQIKRTSVTLPIEGRLLHLRLYLPAEAASVTLDALELKPTTGNPLQWTFEKQ